MTGSPTAYVVLRMPLQRGPHYLGAVNRFFALNLGAGDGGRDDTPADAGG